MNMKEKMDTRVTTDEVASQFGKAIQLLLVWVRQELLVPSQTRTVKSVSEIDRVYHQNLSYPEKLLKAKEVAEILQVSRSQAYRLMSQGEIPTVHVGNSVRVRRGDLEIFIKKGKGL